MKIILFIAVYYGAVMTYNYLKLKKENKITYSNYKMCLMALAENDKELTEYLERNK